uniref:Non-specific serine/threonine protein kinase n=1 Tax=Macrostomum lignano TaxID=282301 RepID=A0A1I8IJ35_9PLAT
LSGAATQPAAADSLKKSTSCYALKPPGSLNRRPGSASLCQNLRPSHSVAADEHNDANNRRLVVQASTAELLKCTCTFLHRRCPDAAPDPSAAAAWIRSVDRCLILQGWADTAFVNPPNLVFLFMLLKTTVGERLATERQLQTAVFACLYVAYSYMGNEISYPLKPFLLEDDRAAFWDRCLGVVGNCSRDMLRLNSDPAFFIDLFTELKLSETQNRDMPAQEVPQFFSFSFSFFFDRPEENIRNKLLPLLVLDFFLSLPAAEDIAAADRAPHFVTSTGHRVILGKLGYRLAVNLRGQALSDLRLVVFGFLGCHGCRNGGGGGRLFYRGLQLLLDQLPAGIEASSKFDLSAPGQAILVARQHQQNRITCSLAFIVCRRSSPAVSSLCAADIVLLAEAAAPLFCSASARCCSWKRRSSRSFHPRRLRQQQRCELVTASTSSLKLLGRGAVERGRALLELAAEFVQPAVEPVASFQHLADVRILQVDLVAPAVGRLDQLELPVDRLDPLGQVLGQAGRTLARPAGDAAGKILSLFEISGQFLGQNVGQQGLQSRQKVGELRQTGLPHLLRIGAFELLGEQAAPPSQIVSPGGQRLELAVCEHRQPSEKLLGGHRTRAVARQTFNFAQLLLQSLVQTGGFVQQPVDPAGIVQRLGEVLGGQRSRIVRADSSRQFFSACSDCSRASSWSSCGWRWRRAARMPAHRSAERSHDSSSVPGSIDLRAASWRLGK